MSIKVHFVTGEAQFYPTGRKFSASPEDPTTSYDVTNKDGKLLAVIPRGNVLRADFLPDDED
jgi:hypothetical protein